MFLNIRISAVLIPLIIILSLAGMEQLSAQNPAEKSAEKEVKKIEKKLSFKKFFHHSDSSKLAKRYIRWHKKLTKGKSEDYRFTIYKDDLKDSIPFCRENSLELTKEVFGWYPHWDKDLYKSLDYSLLSTISYFSYEVNHKTGDTLTTNGWLTDPSIDYMHEKEKKVLLTITNFGNTENRKFLNNPAAADLLIERTIELLKARKAHGVCIDFEGVAKSQKQKFNSFIVYFKQELLKANKEYELYLTVPAVDWNRYLDFEALLPVVDQYIIMGYNYYGKTSKVAGPTAPIRSGKIWDPFNLTTSVDYYLAKKVPGNKLILALPFYGNVWDTKSGKKGAKVDGFVGSRTFDYIKTTIDNVPEIQPQYDSVSMSNWYSFVLKNSGKKKKRQFRQIWFDSDSTMAAKMRLVQTKGLNGVGIWALGYNKKYDTYWKVVEEVFCITSEDPPSTVSIKYPDKLVVVFIDSTTNKEVPVAVDPKEPIKKAAKTVKPPSLIERIWNKLTDFNALFAKLESVKSLLPLALLFVAFFGGVGLLIALFKSDNRKFIFSNTAYTIYYFIFMSLFLLVLIFNWKRGLFKPAMVLIIGFMVAALTLYFLRKRLLEKPKNLP